MLLRRICWGECRWQDRALSTDSKAYSKTLLLPKTRFPQWTDPVKSELPYRERTTLSLYRWQAVHNTGPRHVLHDGPPYANGNLHMGHALNKILKDIINRFHVLQGRRVNYVPGWDCHGLPIEVKTLKELKKEAHQLTQRHIRVAAKKVAEREIETQCAEFQQFGIMADWSKEGTYRTLDESYENRQLRVFQQMVEKGLIYRHFRPVHYSPSSRSALAEAELSYRDNHLSRSVYVLFQLDVPSITSSKLSSSVSDVKPLNLLIWTTTPWTLSANMGIAVHPSMIYSVVEREGDGVRFIVAQERLPAIEPTLGRMKELMTLLGSELVDMSYHSLFPALPNSKNLRRIIPASYVTADSGTGLVHCAPAHGAEDYMAFRSLNILDIQSPDSLLCHIDDKGCYTQEVCDAIGQEHGERLVGKDVLTDGTSVIISILNELGVLVKEEPIEHRYPYDWKTDKPIIVTATSQWFANLDKIKGDAIGALKDVNFYPPASRTRLETFVRSRSEWCISRQRAWGVPIPALHHVPTGDTILDTQSLTHILKILEIKGVDYWWEGPAEEFVPENVLNDYSQKGQSVSAAERWRKGTDTMDVWFDSGSSWALLRDLNIQSGCSDGYYSDVCLEGSDQHRGWFQSMLLTSSAARTHTVEDASRTKATDVETLRPYKTLITHGMVLDQEGKKMSKSLGNVISPLVIVNGGKDKKKDPAYGADVLRFWAASVEYWRDMALGPTILAQSAESLRKIRNTIRFLLGNIDSDDQQMTVQDMSHARLGIADRYVMHELLKLEKLAIDGYTSYNFPRVVTAVSNFANLTLSSLYFDINKDCLYANDVRDPQRRIVVTVLRQILETITNIIAPIAPHLAEEAFYHSRGTIRPGDKSVFMRQWKPISSEWEDHLVEKEMADLLAIRNVVLALLEKARAAKQLKSSLEAEVDLILPSNAPHAASIIELIHREEPFLKTLFIVSQVCLTEEGSIGTHDPKWAHTDSLCIGEEGTTIGVRVRAATLLKCPRCWTYTRLQDDNLCDRCSRVIHALQGGP